MSGRAHQDISKEITLGKTKNGKMGGMGKVAKDEKGSRKEKEPGQKGSCRVV